MENEKFQNLMLEHMAMLTQNITELKQDNIEIIQELNQVKESLIRIENDHGAKINALFDAREVQLDFNRRREEFNLRIEKKVDLIKEKVDTLDQEFEIKLRRVK